VSRDIYQRFVNPDASESRMLLVQRVSIVIFGGLALALISQFQSILAMALFAYSLVGASLTPALLAAFLWKRVTPQGGVACIAGGLVAIVGIAAADRLLGMDFSMTLGGTTFDFASSDYIVLPGVLASTTLLVVGSLLTPASPAEKWQPFFTPPGASLADALDSET
jgi:Na+/proline symporter